MATIARFISSYRWELWLVIGIPTIVRVARLNASYLQDTLDIDWGLTVWVFINITPASVVPSLVFVLLLAVSYPFVRRPGREFLTLLWGYWVVSAVIGLMSFGSLFATGITLSEVRISVMFDLLAIIGFIAMVVHYLALLWFARQASRLSITHAFFFVMFVSLASVGFVQRPDPMATVAVMTSLALGGAIALCVKLVKAWLLGNFDARGSGFRRKAVIALVATTVVAGSMGALAGRLLGSGEFPLPVAYPLASEIYRAAGYGVTLAVAPAALLAVLGIVWLIRVREPRAEAPTTGSVQE